MSRGALTRPRSKASAAAPAARILAARARTAATSPPSSSSFLSSAAPGVAHGEMGREHPGRPPASAASSRHPASACRCASTASRTSSLSASTPELASASATTASKLSARRAPASSAPLASASASAAGAGTLALPAARPKSWRTTVLCVSASARTRAYAGTEAIASNHGAQRSRRPSCARKVGRLATRSDMEGATSTSASVMPSPPHTKPSAK
mmetsp:Transcript_10022/g.41569  ORF Transcript_10022/g.41569 Transcript_10022/m.41569 type:complete len:212 (+) Transcript_10022:275-910(+)